MSVLKIHNFMKISVGTLDVAGDSKIGVKSPIIRLELRKLDDNGAGVASVREASPTRFPFTPKKSNIIIDETPPDSPAPSEVSNLSCDPSPGNPICSSTMKENSIPDIENITENEKKILTELPREESSVIDSSTIMDSSTMCPTESKAFNVLFLKPIGPPRYSHSQRHPSTANSPQTKNSSKLHVSASDDGKKRKFSIPGEKSFDDMSEQLKSKESEHQQVLRGTLSFF